MKDAPHPYRHDDRPAKSEVRYWPLPGNRAARLFLLVVLVGLTGWTAARVLPHVSHRLECTRERTVIAQVVTCTFYEESLTRDPRTLWVVADITESSGVPGPAGIPIMLLSPDEGGVLRYANLPITDPELAKQAMHFLGDYQAVTMSEREGEASLLAQLAPILFAVWAVLVLVRLPRQVVFTIDADRGTLTARFGTLVGRHTTVMPLAEIDRVEVVLDARGWRRLHLIKKDGHNEIFQEPFRPGLHLHDAADLLTAAIARARRDVV